MDSYFSPRLFYTQGEERHESSSSTKNQPRTEQFFADLTSGTNEDPDVIFLVQNRRFHSHKKIVEGSEYLRNLLCCVQLNKQQTDQPILSFEIEILDCSALVFAKILHFLYTDHIELSEHEVWLVYDAAQTYKLHSLISRCENYIFSILSSENIFDVMHIALKVPNSQPIVSACIDFLKSRLHPSPPINLSPSDFNCYDSSSSSTPDESDPLFKFEMLLQQMMASDGATGGSSFSEADIVQAFGPLDQLSNQFESCNVQGNGRGPLSISPNSHSHSRSSTTTGKSDSIIGALGGNGGLSLLNIGEALENTVASAGPSDPFSLENWEIGKDSSRSERLQWSLRSLRSLLDLVQRLVHADRASLFLYNVDSHQLCSVHRAAASANNLEYEIRIPANLGLAGTVFSSGVGVNSRDPYSDPRFYSYVDVITGYRTRTLLCQPIILKSKAEVSGVIQVLNKRTDASAYSPNEETGDGYFTNEDENIVSLVCDLVAAVHERIIPESVHSLSPQPSPVPRHRHANSPVNLNQLTSSPPATSSVPLSQTFSPPPPPLSSTPLRRERKEPRKPPPVISVEQSKMMSWQNYKKRRRDSIPVFHFKLSA